MRSVEYEKANKQRTVIGGYSGPLIVTCTDGNKGTAAMVFVDGEWLPTNLVLSASEAREFGYALMDAARAADANARMTRPAPGT